MSRPVRQPPKALKKIRPQNPNFKAQNTKYDRVITYCYLQFLGTNTPRGGFKCQNNYLAKPSILLQAKDNSPRKKYPS